MPKLTDFGLARMETGDTGHTMSGAVLGTLDFMPPEQRRDATQADARSDLWSLAATLYQMVTGKSPKVIRLNEVPALLQSAIGKALEDKPDDRYQSVAEFRNVLREVVDESRATLTNLTEGQCPSCGTKNEVQRKFCRKCAVSLEVKCLSCSKGMPVWDEVCGSCGTKQSPLITSRKEELQQRQHQAEGFLQEGKFRESAQIAEELQSEADPRFQHLKKWAAEFAEDVKRQQQQQQQRSGVLHKEAKTHQAAHDYSSAIHALEQIPASLRSPDISAMLNQLQTQEQRSKNLYEEIRLRVERRELDGLMPRVDELLQLLPDRVDLRDLRDTLEKREQQRLASRSSATTEAQRLLDARKYAECVAVLQHVDGNLRTPEIEALQKDAATRLSKYAWFGVDKEKTTHLVGTKLPNAWGLYDMHGNVWELCKAEAGSATARRGGGWNNEAVALRSAIRNQDLSSSRFDSHGFRVVCDIPRLDVASSQIGKALPASLSEGLVAFYPFNGDAKDASGNGNHCEQKGTALTLDRFGSDKSAMQIAPGNYVYNNDLSFQIDDETNFSFGLWVNVHALTSGQAYFLQLSDSGFTKDSFASKTSLRTALLLDADFSNSFAVDIGGRGDDKLIAKKTPTVNRWHHIFTVFDQRVVTVFVDGQPYNSCPLTLTAEQTKPTKIIIGHWHFKSDFVADDVQIYDRALSADEIKALYEYESTPPVKTAQAPPPAVSPFNEAQAKAHQKAWADYRGVSVETTNSIGMKFVVIPAGEFMMGSPESEPGTLPKETLHKVTLTQPFQIGTYEVTQSQYEKVVGSNPSRYMGANNPVDTVNWDDAVEFCRLLSALPAERAAGREYRLPTEAEWEYACRAGAATAYSFGDDVSQLGRYAWFEGNGGATTHAVGKKSANPWGLYDMHGNSWEWCFDWDAPYTAEAVSNPQGPQSGTRRSIRSGAFFFNASDVRSASRASGLQETRDRNCSGFRVAMFQLPFSLKAFTPAETGLKSEK